MKFLIEVGHLRFKIQWNHLHYQLTRTFEFCILDRPILLVLIVIIQIIYKKLSIHSIAPIE